MDPKDPQRWTGVSDECIGHSACLLTFSTLNNGLEAYGCWLTSMQTFYNGASARAMYTLGLKKGYTLVATDQRGVNLFFVRSDILACQGVEVGCRVID